MLARPARGGAINRSRWLYDDMTSRVNPISRQTGKFFDFVSAKNGSGWLEMIEWKGGYQSPSDYHLINIALSPLSAYPYSDLFGPRPSRRRTGVEQ